MAVTTQIIHDGPKNIFIKIDIAGANAAAVVVDESALSGATSTIRRFSLKKLQWSLTSTASTDGATLAWDATADVVLYELTPGWGEYCFDGIGIPNNAGAGTTGDIQLTNGAGLVFGTIVMWLDKD